MKNSVSSTATTPRYVSTEYFPAAPRSVATAMDEGEAAEETMLASRVAPTEVTKRPLVAVIRTGVMALPLPPANA